MSRFGARTAGLLVLTTLAGLVALAGCAPSSQGDGFTVPAVGPSKVDVDTPALRAAKAEAGIADCAPGTGSNDLPALTLPCLGGGPEVRLDTLRGPLVVSVWAQWCGPCRQELPYYEQLSEKYAGRLSVIGIDFTDVRPQGALELLAQTGATFPQLADPDGSIAAEKPFPQMDKMPVVLLVDAEGRVVHTQLGEMTSFAELDALVGQQLEVGA